MTIKYYTFSVPCEYFYTVEASNEKEARELLIMAKNLRNKFSRYKRRKS